MLLDNKNISTYRNIKFPDKIHKEGIDEIV
jgi:hypothetical protein